MMINPAEWSLKNRVVLYVGVILLLVCGVVAYQKLGRLESPNFTIKTALITTPYAGASPQEVEDEVTDVIEEAVQSLGELDQVYSLSQEGVSVVFVDMKSQYKAKELAQVWDKLRHKVAQAQALLPPGAGPSQVNDDFGDVYGLFFAITGKGYSYVQLKDYGEKLKKELLLCHDVAKIDFWGLQNEVIYVEFQRAKLAELGLSLQELALLLRSQNGVQPSGKVQVGDRYIRITPTGNLKSEEVIRNLYIGGPNGLVRLGDVARVTREYFSPPRNMMHFNGKPAIGLGISTVNGGNVVAMGEAVAKRLEELESQRPLGMELHSIFYQSEIVVEAVNAFALNLMEAVAIVVGLLMLFMGWQSGILIGFILVLTILATFIGMLFMGITLQKVSLGALILALGMLVDNAIVVADGILVGVEGGQSREEAARKVVRDTQMPLLGATVIAVLAFGSVGLAPGNVGEFCRSLFQVMALSLFLSWIFAVTVTPLLCVKFLKIPHKDQRKDPYERPSFCIYRRVVHRCLTHAKIGVALVILLLGAALWGFRHIPQTFFPPSTRPYFYVDFWYPQGTHIDETQKKVKKLESFIQELPGVKHVTAFIGEGALRYTLAYNYQTPNSSFGQLLVEVDEFKNIDCLVYRIEKEMYRHFPYGRGRCQRIMNGPPNEYALEVRFRGPDKEVLKDLAAQAAVVMRRHEGVRGVRTDWRQRTPVLRPWFAQDKARRNGSSRRDLENSLRWNFNGIPLGLFRERNRLIPILSRPVEEERLSWSGVDDLQVWSSGTRRYIPLQQVLLEGSNVLWEDPIIRRRDRQRAITVQANPVAGLAEPLRSSMVKEMESINLPSGYVMEWAGEYAESEKAKKPLKQTFPLCLGGMFLLLICLFNSLRRPLVIFLTVPLAIIGVAAGLLLTHKAFGFMAILGFLGLSGMLIKNAIVLVDQVELDIRDGKAPYQAVLDSAVSRLRPVTMAAGTTILGMAPLMGDPLYDSMAVTIMGGLFGGTFLTLIVVPLLYTLIFRISPEEKYL